MPLTLHSYSVHLQCDGKELEVYGVQTEDKTISCWVPSEAGKEFTVHWQAVSTRDVFQVKVYMDGRLMSSVAHCGHGINGQMSGVQTEPGRKRHFMFSPLELTDEESPGQDNDVDNLGLIELQLTRAESWKKCSGHYYAKDVSEIGPMNEKTKKAGAHIVSLGVTKDCKDVTGTVTFIGLDKDPFAIYRFRYRPIDLLRAKGIAPPLPKLTTNRKRSGDMADSSSSINNLDRKRPRTLKDQTESPIKNEDGGENDIDDETDEEEHDNITFLEEQLVMLQNRITAAKNVKKTKAVVKREVSPIHVPAQWTNEVIDLT